MDANWSSPVWSQLYPPLVTGNHPADVEIDADPVAAVPHYLDLIAAEARANPVANTLAVEPGINFGGPNPNVLA